MNNNYIYKENINLISKEQQQQKHKIFEAFKTGKLSLRTVKLTNEINYLNKDKKDPRPVYLILPEVPVIMRNTSSHTLGIIEPQTFVAYKSNATTFQVAENIKKIDELSAKCIANSTSLIQKMQEQSERNWEVYPYATSGHLKPDGTFSLPKLKTNFTKEGIYAINHSELLASSYEKQQIKCYCISKTDTRNTTDIVLAKQKLETTLDLKELPIAIYSAKNGSLQVFFVKELITNFEQLSTNEKLLSSFCYMLDISPETMLHTINTLAPIDKINLLQSATLDTDFTKHELIKNAVELVSHPKNYSIAKLNYLIAQGFTPNIKVYYKYEYLSLADILILTKFKNRNICQKQPEQALALFIKLILNGCSLEDMSLVRLNMLTNAEEWIKTYFILTGSIKDIGCIILFSVWTDLH